MIEGVMTTISFKWNGKTYQFNVPSCKDGREYAKRVRHIYKAIGAKKPTHQKMTFPEWNFWVKINVGA